MNYAYKPVGLIGKSANKSLSWPIWLMCFLLMLPVMLSPFVGTVVSSVLILFSVVSWMFSMKVNPPYVIKLILPFLLLLMIGSVGILSNKNYDVFKDVWYVANPLLIMLAGFVLMYNLRDFTRLSRAFVIVGVITSLFHLIKFVLHPELLSMSANDLRNSAGRGYLISILSIGLLVVSWKMKCYLFIAGRWLDSLFFLICGASFVMSFSREMTLSLLLFLGCIMGYIQFIDTRRLVKFTIAAVLGLSLLLTMPVPSYVNQQSTFVDKILYSIQEMKVKDYTSLRDINTNWRGYETARALNTYRQGEYWQYLVGQGFGTSVDLGLYMPMGDEYIRFAPILHNGYMFLLVKMGALGVMLYLGFLVSLVKIGNICSRSNDIEEKYTGRLIVGLACVIFTSTFVISGIFNKEVMIAVELLLGAMVANAARQCEKDGDASA